MNQPIRKRLFAGGGTLALMERRAATALLLALLTAMTAWAQTTSTINVGSTDYTLFTGFTATDGNGTNYAKLVDGNTSTDWIAKKNYDDPNAPAGHFNGGTEDPAFVEFHADAPFIPKGYVLTCYHENAGFWKPYSWALKARLNESDGWTTIQSSTTTLGQGKTFEIACDNDGDNEYQYFRFEVYEVGTTRTVDLDELQFYGSLSAYTHLTVKAATCMATGIKQDCYRRNSDGKYFTDETGATELAESDVIAPIIPHTGVHHDATDTHIKYWQCSMCGKYFSDEGCTTEITEEQTKIYRTITIDNSISGLVEVAFSKTQALAGESIILYVDYQVDASTLKVNDGAVELTAVTDIQYAFTMPAADVTVTADVAQSNADGDVLTGSIRHTVTIPDGASITLNNATITGGIVCNGTATITLVGTNSVSGATNKAGIQVGGSGTTLTIRGDGSLTVTGGYQSAGIGLSRAWNVTEDVVGGNIVINGGNITANGGGGGAGIGAGVTKDPNNSSSRKAIVGTITIAGGSVTAVGGSNADGIGAGENNYNATIQIGTVTIYDGIDKVDASSITNFASVVYMHGETNVTASKTDYFAIGEDGNRRLIVQKPVIAEIAEQTYTGSTITPEPTVTIGSLSLTKGTDYTYSYTNNTNVGTATVRATFQGTYASLGYVEKTFTIAPRTYTVSFDANGGTGTMEPMQLTYDGDWVTLTANTFTRTGYSFKGWNTEADGTGTDYSDEDLVCNLTDEANGNVVLYAQWGWDIASCEIRGTLEAYDNGYGPYYPLSNNVEVWNGDTQLTLDTDYTIELDPDVDDYVVGEQYQATIKGTGDWFGTKTFTFTFVEMHHTVVFVANGGSGTMASDVATKGQLYTLPPCGFTAPLGKVFDHWVVDYTGIEEDPIKQPGDYFTAPYIWSESDVQTITVTAYWRDALILLDDDSNQPVGSKNADIIAANDGTTELTVQLQGRTLYKDGKWNTLCLPFALSAEQIAAHADFAGATLKELDTDGKNGFDTTDGTLYLTFKAATAIAAGVPYLVKWDAAGTDFTSPTFSGVTIDATASTTVSDADGELKEVQMVGCYSPVSVTANDKSILFLGDTNTLYYSSIDRNIRSCRAYFSVPYIKEHAGAKARAFRLDFGDGEQTGIMTVQGEGFLDEPSGRAERTVNGADAWYTLDGRKLDGKPATKGLYINGGKKVAIK